MFSKSIAYIAVGYLVVRKPIKETIERNDMTDPVTGPMFKCVMVLCWPVIAVAQGIDKINELSAK